MCNMIYYGSVNVLLAKPALVVSEPSAEIAHRMQTNPSTTHFSSPLRWITKISRALRMRTSQLNHVHKRDIGRKEWDIRLTHRVRCRHHTIEVIFLDVFDSTNRSLRQNRMLKASYQHDTQQHCQEWPLTPYPSFANSTLSSNKSSNCSAASNGARGSHVFEVSNTGCLVLTLKSPS
jgi:hypothetical protein